MFKKRSKQTEAALHTQLRTENSHPFTALSAYTPLLRQEAEIYRSLREALPILDAAITKLVRLTGGFTVDCADPGAAEALRAFLAQVPVGGNRQGVAAFLMDIAAYVLYLRVLSRAKTMQ